MAYTMRLLTGVLLADRVVLQKPGPMSINATFHDEGGRFGRLMVWIRNARTAGVEAHPDTELHLNGTIRIGA
jgi:hypothetical protein